jgi:hypothetical protein
MRPALALVHSTPPRSARLQGWELIWSPLKWPPFEPQIWVQEQDVWGLLGGEDEVLRDPGTSLDALEQEMQREPPRLPGSVRVTARRPLRLEAVVYDLEQQACCQPAWVRQALSALFSLAAAEGLSRIALPPLGARPGALSEPEWMLALDDALCAQPGTAGRLWIIEAVNRTAPAAGPDN